MDACKDAAWVVREASLAGVMGAVEVDKGSCGCAAYH